MAAERGLRPDSLTRSLQEERGKSFSYRAHRLWHSSSLGLFLPSPSPSGAALSQERQSTLEVTAATVLAEVDLHYFIVRWVALTRRWPSVPARLDSRCRSRCRGLILCVGPGAGGLIPGVGLGAAA